MNVKWGTRRFSRILVTNDFSISRCFINPRGIPNAPESRHVLFSMSAENSYAGKVMTGVFDAVWVLSNTVDRRLFGKDEK